MLTIGLIGGMSWESSAEYYRLINQSIQKKLGGAHSARSLMVSVDFGEIEKLQHEGRWDILQQKMVDAARQLQFGGADFIVLCTNTMHRFADAIESAIIIPFLHIADATAQRIETHGFKKVGLLGTRFTMEQDFYKRKLTVGYGLDVLVPEETDRATVHRIIYDELVKGVVTEQSRQNYRAIIDRLVRGGAEAIIFGCTEISLLVDQSDSAVPVFDTTAIHAQAAVEKALEQTI
ncbi:aspartate/glutamate racemase family protein [Bartonella sp. LJL80]